ncbi:putative gamma-tubulin complex [Trypoxylus dichotomus]
MQIDYKIAIHNVVSNTSPRVAIAGYLVHLSQAWYRKIQSIKLTQNYKNYTDMGQILKYLFELQFLNSNEIGDPFLFELAQIMPNNSKLEEFCHCLVHNYISESSEFPPYNWANLSALLCRTTNACV